MHNMLRAPITYVGISQVKSAYAFVKGKNSPTIHADRSAEI